MILDYQKIPLEMWRTIYNLSNDKVVNENIALGNKYLYSHFTSCYTRFILGKLESNDVLNFIRNYSGKITALNLSQCIGITDENVIEIFQKYQDLISLDLSNSRITFDDRWNDVAILKNIEHLILQDCEGLSNLSIENIVSRMPYLKSLNFSYSREYAHQPQRMLLSQPIELAKLKNLEYVNFQGRIISKIEAPLFHLARCPSLVFAFFDYDAFTKNDLIEFLATCTTVRSLNIAGWSHPMDLKSGEGKGEIATRKWKSCTYHPYSAEQEELLDVILGEQPRELRIVILNNLKRSLNLLIKNSVKLECLDLFISKLRGLEKNTFDDVFSNIKELILRAESNTPYSVVKFLCLFPNLERLFVDIGKIDHVVDIFKQSSNPKLHELRITLSEFTLSRAVAISKAFPNLKLIVISNSKISKKAVQRLQEKCKDIRVACTGQTDLVK